LFAIQRSQFLTARRTSAVELPTYLTVLILSFRYFTFRPRNGSAYLHFV
jgi:hypothetical protein